MPSLGNQEYIRDMNSRLVLKEIIHKEPLSRAEISKNLGLTKATVSSIVQDFIRKGYVAEIGSLDTDKGRKPILLKFDADCAFTLSVYLNVDATSVLIANLRGQNRQTFSYPAITDAASPSDRLAGYIQDAMTHCPPSRYGIIGIAVGVLGVVHNNTIAFTPYYTIDRPELGSYLSERFGIPVYVENEANFSAQGEWAFFHSYPSLININIHAGMIILLIFFKHSCNIFLREAHINPELCSNVPRAVIFMFPVRSDFSFYVFNIVHTGKNYGLKSRGHISVDVISSELRKEIEKDLIF